MENFEFLRDLALLMMLSKVLEIFLQQYRISKIVPYILTGMILGPFVFGIIQDSELITLCAKIGAVLLVFEAGLATRMSLLQHVPRPVIYIAGLSVLFSLFAGAIIYMIFYGFGPIGSENLLKGLFFGIILSSTSLYSISRLRRQIGNVWNITLNASVLNNMLVIVVLTLALGVKINEANLFLVILRAIMLAVLGYAAGLLLRSIVWFLEDTFPRFQSPSILYFSFALLLAYFSARYFGLPDVTGAYIAGIVLQALYGENPYQVKEMDCHGFFTSLFFIGIGLSTSLGSLDLRLLIFGIILIVFGLTFKTAGSVLGAVIGRYDSSTSMRIGISMMPEAELSLIAVWKGIEAGLLGGSFMIPVICLVFGSLFIFPNILKRM